MAQSFYRDNPDRSESISEKAIKRIQEERLPPTPDIYELWYVYYADNTPEVTRAIDMLLDSGQKLDEARCREIYQQFLDDDQQSYEIRRAGDQISFMIKDLLEQVHEIRGAASGYGETLDEMEKECNKADSLEDLTKLLATLTEGTRDMINKNEALEEKLDESTVIMEELQTNLDKVQKEALTDGLTGLSNRKSFDIQIRTMAEQAQEENTTFSLLMIDIDHFKNFNDSFGHQVGDQVLRLVSRTLTDGIQGQDFASRFGGEEFAILLPHTDVTGATAVANRLRKMVENKDVINRATGKVLARITMSLGVAEYLPGEEISELVDRADGALYTAKHNGRNQVAAAPNPDEPGKAKQKA